jgi:NlpC/P60 family protein
MGLPGSRRTTRAVLLIVSTSLAAALLPAVAASAATQPVGHLDSVSQASNGRVSLRAWAYDPGRSGSTSWVDIYIDGRLAGQPAAFHPRPDVNRAKKVQGNHGVVWSKAWTKHAHVLKFYARPIVKGEVRTLIHTSYLNGYRPPTTTPGTRIIAEAKKFVGHDAYVYGGTSPTTGFDCSGYTQYVYRVTKVANLPRTAEQQRHAVRLIPRTQARPGDLVFYMQGGSAFHIAIYAGNGRQYAAANERQDIINEPVWSSAVQYGTTWH